MAANTLKLSLLTEHHLTTEDHKLSFRRAVIGGCKDVWRVMPGNNYNLSDMKIIPRKKLLKLEAKSYKEMREKINILCKQNNIPPLSDKIIRQNEYFIKEFPVFCIIRIKQGWIILFDGIEYDYDKDEKIFNLWDQEMSNLTFSTRREALDFLATWTEYNKEIL